MTATPITCPKCGEVLEVEIPLGLSIWRTLDKALLAHNKKEHREHPDDRAEVH